MQRVRIFFMLAGIAATALPGQAVAFLCSTPQITEHDQITVLKLDTSSPPAKLTLELEPATAKPGRVITLREFQLASGGDAWRRSESLPGPDGKIRIGVAFLDGDEFQKKAVIQFASEWMSAGGAETVEFVFGNSERNHIRVTFAADLNDNWSAIGRQAEKIDKSRPTMRLGDVRRGTPDDRVRQVIRHEFGHALGLRHEHQHPQGGISWDKRAVVADLTARGWTEREVETNFFKVFETSFMCLGSPGFDPKSIMMYPIQAHWLQRGSPVGENYELVSADRACVRSLYP
jgi:hypothetical protein